MESKTIFVSFGISKSRFRDNFFVESELQKYLRAFSLQIVSIKDYFYDLFNNYKFFSFNFSFKGITKNFFDYFETEGFAEEQNLRDLARSFNIQASDPLEILFEWESKFLEKSTKVGINNYVKLKTYYEVYKKTKNENLARSASDELFLNIYEWHDFDISEDSDTVYTPENQFLSVYIEIVLPKTYFIFLSNYFAKVKEIFNFISKELPISVKVKYIEIIWR